MDRRRVELPGLRQRCRRCGDLVRRHRGFDEELADLRLHRCPAPAQSPGVAQPASWWRRLCRALRRIRS